MWGWVSATSNNTQGFWCPSLLTRAWRYASSLYVIAWEEQAASRWLEVWTGVPILSATSGLSFVVYFWFLPKKWQKKMRYAMRDFLASPVKYSSGGHFSDVKAELLNTARQLHFE